jgi:hypothetical protein
MILARYPVPIKLELVAQSEDFGEQDRDIHKVLSSGLELVEPDVVIEHERGASTREELQFNEWAVNA